MKPEWTVISVSCCITYDGLIPRTEKQIKMNPKKKNQDKTIELVFERNFYKYL